MSNRTWWRHHALHPSERDLLLYVNGEGGGKLARRVRNHVDGCWSCSLKRDRLASAIAAFMREREAGLGAEDLSEAVNRRFESKLRRLVQNAESSRAETRRGTTRHLLPSAAHSFVALGLGVAIIALFWLRFSSIPSVSAREILDRVKHAEARRIAEVREPVVHQRFEVTGRRSGQPPRSVYLETWHDPRSNRWSQETEEAAAVSGALNSNNVVARNQSHRSGPAANHSLVAELQDILKVNDMHRQPISASAFADWRAKLRRADERVMRTSLENGDKAFTIATSVAEPQPRNAIVKSEFVVREQDLHPVRHRFSVSEPNGLRSYEIRETSFEVVALSSLAASIFAPPALPAAAAPVTLQATSSNRPSTLENPMGAVELEISLSHLLHQANACAGEEVEVITGSSGKLEVRGVVASAERRQQLTRLIAEYPQVPVKLQVPGDVEPNRPALSSETLPGLTAVATQPGSSPIKDYLVAHFAQLELSAEARRARTLEFSNRVIAEAELADLHAWELHRLARRFNAISLERISPSARTKFQSMARDHLRALARSVGRSDELLRPVLASLGSTPNAGSKALTSSTTEGKDLPSCFVRVFESVTTAVRLVFGLFDGAGSNASVFESSSALLAGLPRILDDIREADSQLSGLVSSSEPKVISARPIERSVP